MIDMKPIRVLLAEDHTLVRAGIRVLLEECGWIKVIAETGEGNEALRLVKKERPDLVLMDIAMPGLNGIEATARIKKEYPETKVIILSMYANEEYVLQALRDGASGYLLKDCAFEEVIQAVRTVAADSTYLGTKITEIVIKDYVNRFPKNELSALSILSTREREVLQLLSEGKKTKEIGDILGVSIKTAETFRQKLMEKLNIHSIAELTKLAIREGLTSL